MGWLIAGGYVVVGIVAWATVGRSMVQFYAKDYAQQKAFWDRASSESKRWTTPPKRPSYGLYATYAGLIALFWPVSLIGLGVLSYMKKPLPDKTLQEVEE